MARKENVIKIIGEPLLRDQCLQALQFYAMMRGQPCAGDDATFQLQGAIQHNPSWFVSPWNNPTISDNKGQNCAHGLGAARLHSSVGISLLCAVITYCVKKPFISRCRVATGCDGVARFLAGRLVYWGEELVLALKCCSRDRLSCRAPCGCSRALLSAGGASEKRKAWESGVLFPPLNGSPSTAKMKGIWQTNLQ